MAHLTEREIQRFRERELTVSELSEFDAHIARCVQCRQQLVTGDVVHPLLRAIDVGARCEPQHLTREQLWGYVEGTHHAIDREIIASHIHGCEPCAAEVQDLRGFNAQMSTHLPQHHTPEGRRADVRPGAPSRMSAAGRWAWMAFTAGAAMAASLVFALGVRPAWDRLASDSESARQARDAPGRMAGRLLEKYGPTRLPAPNQERAERQRLAAALHKKERETARLQMELAAALKDAPVPDSGSRHPRAAAERDDKPLRLPQMARELIGTPETVMSTPAAEAFRLLSPVGTATASDHPEFSWETLKGAERYEIRVRDDQGNPVVSQEVLPARGALVVRWTPDAGQKFSPGRRFTWQVKAYLAGGASEIAPGEGKRDASFRVINLSDSRRVEKAAAEVRARSARDYVELGRLFLQASLLDDAQRAFEAAVNADPAYAPAGKRLAELQKLRYQSRGSQ
jgi:hypothetical protein